MTPLLQVREPLALPAGFESPIDGNQESSAAAAAQAEIRTRLCWLDAAIEAARAANISVARAKRLAKELHVQGAAAAAALELQAVLRGSAADASAANLKVPHARTYDQ